MLLRPRQETFVGRCAEALHKHKNTLGVAPTGFGKCPSVNTPVLMFDGTVKRAGDVVAGDLLMGWDSKPRHVINATPGFGPMYRITPVKGDPWECNDAHILTLQCCGGGDYGERGAVIDVDLQDWLKWPASKKHEWKQFRVGTEFGIAKVEHDPYFVGLYLGDGRRSNVPSITTCDRNVEVAEWIDAYAAARGYSVRKQAGHNCTDRIFNGGMQSPVSILQAELSLHGRSIPSRYLINSRENRLKLLAGLIDTDGYTVKTSIEYVTKYERLANDICFLARSLGFAAYKKRVTKGIKERGFTGQYWRIGIDGDTHLIPILTPRRRPLEREQKKSVLRTGFSVERIEDGWYQGIAIDGDHRYLLGDFTVTHNTIVLGATIGRIGGQSLVVQHRDELVDQNRKKFKAINPGVQTDLYTADRKRFVRNGVTFGMAQTLIRNLEEIPELDLLAIDECHHAASDSYIRIVDAARKKNPEVKIFGVTATPHRGDRKNLAAMWNNVADQVTLGELIQDRLLVPPRAFVIDTGTREALKGVRKLISDFDMAEVEKIMNKRAINDKVVAEWKEKAGDRQTVVFTSTVEHAMDACDAFQRAGVSAAVVTGEMPSGEREKVLKAFDRREIQVVVNVAVLTEGWDCQPVSCVVLLRPCSFKSTVIQMVGRGLRKVDPELYPGVHKEDCIVLDFGYSLLTHGDLEQHIDMEMEKPPKDCPQCAASVPAGAYECPLCGYAWPRQKAAEPREPGEKGETEFLTDFVLTEVDLLKKSPFRWEDLFGDGSVTMAHGLEAWVSVIHYRGRWCAVGGSKETGIRVLSDNDDRLLTLSTADDFLREHGDAEAAKKSKRWVTMPPSDKQLEHLGLNKLAGLSLNRYRASCLLQWKWCERAIGAKLMAIGDGRKAA